MKHPLYLLLCLLFCAMTASGQNELYIQSGAGLTVESGVEVTVQGAVVNHGMIDGSGTLGGTVTNNSDGTIAPGNSPGCQIYTGDLVNLGKIEIELDDGTACTDFDQIQVTGNANVGGNIEVIFIGGSAPTTTTYIVLTTSGAITLNSPSISWPMGYSGTFSVIGGNQLQLSFALLPVELTDFRATLTDDNSTLLFWKTESETDNEGFEVEHSTDGRGWQKIGFVAGHGTTLEAQSYSFTDGKPLPGLNYYRLRQMDFDGQSEYSPVVSISKADGKSAPQVYPNPVAHGELTLYFPDSPNETSVLSIYSPSGQMLRRQPVSSSESRVDVSGLAAGIYLLQVVSGREVWQERVVVE